MNHVHTRNERKQINLSDKGQPISDDDDHLLSEFSNFLGAVVREFVSLTCRTWHEVPEKEILWRYVKVMKITYFVVNWLHFQLGLTIV